MTVENKIAILGSYSSHLECIPFILECFKEYQVDIFLSSKSDKYGWIDYCKTLHNKISLFIDFFDIFDNSLYELSIKLTSCDPCNRNNNVATIVHHPIYITRNINKICLTPYLVLKKFSGYNINYLFPAFRPIISNLKKENIISCIGLIKRNIINNLVDIENFIILNKNFIFNFVVSDSKAGYNIFNKYKNVKIYSKISTKKLLEIVSESKYMLAKKDFFVEKFSGQLSLAVSFEVPLILDKDTQDRYNLPGFSFKEKYMEIGNLEDVDNKTYISEVNKVKIFKNQSIESNIKKLNKLKK